MAEHSNFETTQWSVVISAGMEDSSAARNATSELCQRYWYPLYAFIRRRGHKHADAEDMVQAFFARVIEKDVFTAANKDKGRFRTFLLSSLENFMNNENVKSNTLRRGGGHRRISLDAPIAEGNLRREIADHSRPEDEYDRQWAVTVLNRVLTAIESEYASHDKADLFRQLRPYLSTDSGRKPYRDIAQHLGMNEANVKVAVHRLRRRYRNQLELEIASTVTSPSEIDDEIRLLFTALGGESP